MLNVAAHSLPGDSVSTAPTGKPARAGDISAAVRRAFAPVAAFDERLLCQAMNSAFCSLVGTSQQQCLGKTMQDILKSPAPQFEAALQRVWHFSEFLREQRITVRPAGRRSDRRWIADFFPLPEDANFGRLVGVAFSEVTTHCRIESRILRLARSHALNSNNVFSPNTWVCAPLPRGYLELMQRTVGLLTSSLEQRRLLSEMRVADSLRNSGVGQRPADLGKTLAAFAGPCLSPDAPADSSSMRCPPETLNGFNRPSSRELQVLRFLAEGRCNKEIASALRLSIRTIETYRARLMSKLKVHSAAEAVCYAIRNQLIQA